MFPSSINCISHVFSPKGNRASTGKLIPHPAYHTAALKIKYEELCREASTKKPTTLWFGKNGLIAKTQHLPHHYCVKAFLGAHTVDNNMGQTVVSGRDINHSRGRHQTFFIIFGSAHLFYRTCRANSWLAKPLLKWRMIRPHKTSRDRFDVV